jgi:hypothetical protein
MKEVFVLNNEGQPLMPTRWSRAKRLINSGDAVVVSHSPFVIRLTRASKNYKQKIVLGIDPGYSYIGISAVTEKEELISWTIEQEGAGTKNTNPVSKRLAEKLMYRRNKRSRLWHRKARWQNRTKSKKEGWIAPSMERKLITHINVVNRIKKFLPINKIVVEKNKFDMAKIDNSEISGVDYQHGKLFSYINQKMYLIHEQNGICPVCGEPLKGKINVHHVIYQRDGGSNNVNNLVCLHEECHKKLHDENLKLKKSGFKKKHKSDTAMNIIRLKLIETLNSEVTYGSATASIREEYNITKTHNDDAFVIAGGTTQRRATPVVWQQRRRNNRCLQTNNIKSCKTCRTGKRIRKSRNKFQSGDLVFVNKKMYICGGTTGGYVVIGFKKSIGGHPQAITLSPKKVTKHFQNGSVVMKTGGLPQNNNLNNNRLDMLSGQ